MARALTVAGVLAMAVLATGSGSRLLADAYAGYAESQLHASGSDRVAEASRLAALLTPWSAAQQGLHGWILTERRLPEEAHARYRTALRWAPADPLVWTEYALSLARTGRFDEALLHAIGRAHTLAPYSPAVHDSIAAIGLNYWRHGTEKLQALWLLSMRYERDHSRQTFLGQVAARGQARTFCSEAGPRLGEEAWCATIQQMVERCRGEGGDESTFSLCQAGR